MGCYVRDWRCLVRPVALDDPRDNKRSRSVCVLACRPKRRLKSAGESQSRADVDKPNTLTLTEWDAHLPGRPAPHIVRDMASAPGQRRIGLFERHVPAVDQARFLSRACLSGRLHSARRSLSSKQQNVCLPSPLWSGSAAIVTLSTLVRPRYLRLSGRRFARMHDPTVGLTL